MANRKCEDCGDEILTKERRRKCKNCGQMICGWCFGHTHNFTHYNLDNATQEECDEINGIGR